MIEATLLNNPFHRKTDYLRISFTDHCDFRCFDCLPGCHRDFETPDDWLTPDEIERLVTLFTALIGIEELSLITNASGLSQVTEALNQAGVRRLNISLASLDEARFRQITGSQLKPVLAGIARARALGLSPIIVNMMVLRGINDSEVESMVEYCLSHDLTLRFIETMPLEQGGEAATERHMPLSEVEARLRRRYRLGTTAMRGSDQGRYFRIDDSELVIGFTTPQSQNFCDTCNRVWVSVSGDLYLCPGQEDKLALRPLLRRGASDESIKQAIRSAIARQPQQDHINQAPAESKRLMTATGS